MLRAQVLFSLVIACGCAHKPETKPEAMPPKEAPPAAAPAAPAPVAEKTCSSDLDCGAKQLCVRSHCVDITADLAECQAVRIHFALDSSEIEEGDKTSLDRSARCLRADRALHVTVEGNADERGTEEYNLALGDRRATAVMRRLESLGATAAQLKSVSYGKENPLCVEHDETCWHQNRRAELQVADHAKTKTKAPKHR